MAMYQQQQPQNVPKSILIIGATGKTGLAVIDQLAQHPSQPSIHVMCRNRSKLSQTSQNLCSSVVFGNARNAYDIERALADTQADWIVVSVGNGEHNLLAKNDIRTANAEAIVSVLRQSRYQHVRVLAVSSTGAGTSRIVVGLGLGRLFSYHLKHVLADHTGQEKTLMTQLSDRRVTIVRATSLTNDKPTGNLVYFGDNVKSPSIQTDRADLAAWIAEEICRSSQQGRVVNVTSVSIRQ
jgi:NAD(P)-dependent dehydrogenase (short-subunit alcohol dehydrogenase family)